MRTIACIPCLLGLAAAACSGPPVDLTHALQVDIVSSGWYDAGIVNGQNKLVPATNVRLTNASDRKLSVLQLNALFRRVNSNEEWGSAFLTVAGSEGLAPGATTGVLLLKSANGYTGSGGDSRQQMLENSHFVDARVEIQAKYGSTQWVKIADYPLPRQLITK